MARATTYTDNREVKTNSYKNDMLIQGLFRSFKNNIINEPIPQHDYVEIAGIKWATMNVGANSITDYGLYFQWGDTQGYTAEQVGTGEGQKAFSWSDYKWSDNGTTAMTKYNSTDDKTVLDSEDDVVTAACGGNWRMPTTEEWQAFGSAVNTSWASNYDNSGVAGLVCTDKTDSSKVLFFPVCGRAGNGSMSYVGRYGEYWSSSLYGDSVYDALGNDAWGMEFASYNVDCLHGHRCFGFAVRGVKVDI